jgi:hypothetical protein
VNNCCPNLFCRFPVSVQLARQQRLLNADVASSRVLRLETNQEPPVSLSLAIAIARLLGEEVWHLLCTWYASRTSDCLKAEGSSVAGNGIASFALLKKIGTGPAVLP